MLLGALVDLGLPLDALRSELAKLPLGGYHLEARKVDRSGLAATKVDVQVEGQGHDHVHDHQDPHGHHHGHEHEHDHDPMIAAAHACGVSICG